MLASPALILVAKARLAGLLRQPQPHVLPPGQARNQHLRRGRIARGARSFRSACVSRNLGHPRVPDPKGTKRTARATSPRHRSGFPSYLDWSEPVRRDHEQHAARATVMTVMTVMALWRG